MVSCGSSQGSEVLLEGPYSVVWKGNIDLEGAGKLDEIFLRSAPKSITFVESFGGTRAATERVVALVRAHALQTQARGNCRSACALAFLAGRDRTMLAPLRGEAPTMLGLHGYYHSKTHLLLTPEPGDTAYLREVTGGRMSAELIHKVTNTTNIRGGLMVLESSIASAKRVPDVIYCDSPVEGEKLRCETVPGQTAASLGLIDWAAPVGSPQP